MPTVFLSYSTQDHYFAELADIKLAAAGIDLWRDQGSLVPGTAWRQGIELGITDSIAVVVALSAASADSSYVTYEWAYAMGKNKPVIPLKLTECKVHPRLEPIQYLDFSKPGSLPWESLVERIREIETEQESKAEKEARERRNVAVNPEDEADVKAILAYLNQRGYRMASFERLRKRINEKLTDERFRQLIQRNSSVFRKATLKGGKPGLAKLHT